LLLGEVADLQKLQFEQDRGGAGVAEVVEQVIAVEPARRQPTCTSHGQTAAIAATSLNRSP
jgi:hypothetical protein